ncbi:fructosamine kinase family protein [Thiomicrospira pelophila]|uniref:fructosamine kinase family protein n=1 Tax=Thiomicrospira pelophila TaxID=934 RepID=UPI0004A72764|nr:fructosamine kinase family protein [Thiomicrospira pelophila]
MRDQAWLTPIIQQALGDKIEVKQAKGISGGDIHQAWWLQTSQGDYFLKTNHPKAQALFASEALALDVIQATQTICSPQVIHHGANKHQAWLLMQYIEMQSQGDDYLRGQQLAQMHRQTHPQFGWQQNNFIGHTPQLNTWQDSWPDFYAQQRLKPQLQLAQQNGAPITLIELVEQLISKIDSFFQTYQPQASLLHGDLWAGNSAFDTQGLPIIFDPASYYGDRETDIAMTELFGGYSDQFYAGYESEWPLDSGYQSRKNLYNLYHVLNHYNLFGGYYAQQAERLLRELVA